MFPQIMLYAVTFFLFVTSNIATARAEWQDDSRPTQASVIEIAAWVSANADLPIMKELPGIVLVPSAELTRLRDKGLMSFYSGSGPGAAYDDTTRTIYLPETWTDKSPTDQSVLVHEVVHHMQNQAGMTFACDDARAEPAYLAQEKWLQKHGLTLKQAFQVDMFALETMASCM